MDGIGIFLVAIGFLIVCGVGLVLINELTKVDTQVCHPVGVNVTCHNYFQNMAGASYLDHCDDNKTYNQMPVICDS